MLNLERIPDQVGYLVLTEDGAVVASGGELENDEHLATNITELVYTSEVLEQGSTPENKFQKITVVYDDYTLGICLSNKRIHVVKRRTHNQQVTDAPLVDMN
ncbi:Hypothetical predicted protein [Cloeon dipterum]|uniref:Late endosomal/lysosomal adaptor and MAPK and MTOR activator 4 n=1 Tax=Cloeon dipterum TaxID=197152 RepID=A0A8S1D0D3_9INSE|nr:Hypothetical predicted protein [Cloeon dipterum]